MSHRKACDPANGRPIRTGETHLAVAGLDTVELDCLTLARHFILGMQYPENEKFWQQFEGAAARFGPRDAHAISYAVGDLVRAVRLCRKSTFVFSNPNCPGCRTVLTAPERHMILALAAMRRDQRSIAAAHIMLLCEGHPDQQVHTILRALAVMLPEQRRKPVPTRPSRMKWSSPK